MKPAPAGAPVPVGQKVNSMFSRSTGILIAGLALIAGCQQQPGARTVQDYSDDEKAIYAFGVAVGRQLGQQTKQLRLTPVEVEVFRAGLGDALQDKTPLVELGDYEKRFQSLAEARLAAGAAEAEQKSASFIEEAAKAPGAVTTGSGLVFQTLSAGDGARPKASDTVKVHYQGTLVDGTVFDSSIQRGEPVEFGLDRVIPCWTEGVQRMQVGEKARLVCPSALAYGERGAGSDIPPNSTLVFEVELLGIKAP